MANLKDSEEVRLARLTPEALYEIAPEEEGTVATLGRWYNRVGSLIDLLAAQHSIDPNAALVLWTLDQGEPGVPGARPEIRVDLNLLFKHWGNEYPSIFDRHFRFGSRAGQPGAPWQGQQWRSDEDDDWQAVHIGSQKREYEVFAFIMELAGAEAAYLASRLLRLRIDCAQHAQFGYKTGAAIFAATRQSERWQVCLFFEQLRSAEVLDDVAKADWVNVAKKRGGEERPPSFQRRVVEALDAAKELSDYPKSTLPHRGLGHGEKLYSIDLSQVRSLPLHSQPAPAAVLAVLGEGDVVEKRRQDGERPEWWYVEALIDGNAVKGWVDSQNLKEGIAPSDRWPSRARLPVSHLARQSEKRVQAEGRSYPLNEGGLPARTAAGPIERRQQLDEIVDSLGADNPDHLRYQAEEGGSSAATYAYDFCRQARVYLPRVWWRDQALLAFGAGEVPHVVHGSTVSDVSTNRLFDWLRAFGSDYGWARQFHIGELQRAANQGRIGLIIAQSREPDAPGHVSLVVPERQGIAAARKEKKVVRPVESHAGLPLGPSKKRWWLDKRYSDFAFWVHD